MRKVPLQCFNCHLLERVSVRVSTVWRLYCLLEEVGLQFGLALFL